MQPGRTIGQGAPEFLRRVGRSPVVVVVAVVALAAAAATGTGQPSGPDGRSPLIARSGPSPGSSIVVEEGPAPADPASLDGQPPSPAGAGAGAGAVSAFAGLAARPATVFATDFTDLEDDWEIYHSAGHAGLGLRRPSAITMEPSADAEGGSVLTITASMGTEGDEAGELVSGGMALLRPRTYGIYTYRMRVDPDPAEVTSGVAILWPWSNRWPEDGELDMVEMWVNRSTRAPVESNIHYLDPFADAPYADTDDRLLSFVHSGLDGSRWHTYRFEWRADHLSMAVDDGPMRVLTDDPLHIPDWLMVPTFQLDAFPAPGRSRDEAAVDGPVRLQVDWLVIEE